MTVDVEKAYALFVQRAINEDKAGSMHTYHIIQLFHTFLCNSQNYHPRGAVDDPMHCSPRPKAEGNSASGHPQHRGGDSLTVA